MFVTRFALIVLIDFRVQKSADKLIWSLSAGLVSNPLMDSESLAEN